MIPKDPEILYSFLSLKLRDEYDSLERLCDGLDVDCAELEAAVLAAGYRYDEAANRLVACRKPGGIV